ncbi:major facilitator superfamily transporter [Colletotrichum karsti]|uniref:Major facilitator superfamily transporter n=1 Tax=Colletotrichum karsti TaxID=1095194 RepID=A0A9P6I6H0_9PEZI|nr:major facilitator superfamily transporter [Colletotrichum karsti]KAF9877129.1 major facilitator superfamily transporter [Colletotrichum karsti]
MNWSPLVKWTHVLTIATISFLVPVVSAMLAPAVPQVMSDFNTTSSLFATFVVSIFVLGFACGPLILAPLSEMYGRQIIYNVTNVIFMIATILCGFSQNEGMLLFFRFLAGFSGVATITIGSGTIADLMPREKRGKAVSIWSVGTILGPTIGPIIGGEVVDRGAGWRWVFWSISIVIAVVTIFTFLVLRETYPPVLLEWKAAKLRKETSNPNYRSYLATDLTPRELFRRSIVRPVKLLLCCPLVTVMCTYVAIPYGTLYLLYATYSFVFTEVYKFSALYDGLVFLPGGIGTLMGAYYIGTLSDRIVRRRIAAGGMSTPEDRLSLIITVPAALTFPAGLLMYGWCVEYHVHWIVPQIGTAVTGFGSILIFSGIQTYLIDAFEGYAASAVGANAVLRGLVGAFLPLSGLSMYHALGWGWGNSLLAFLTLACAPIPWTLAIYGAKIRNLGCNKVKL